MAKLSSSFKKANRTARTFRDQLAKLPADVLELARGAAVLFHRDPAHPSLRRHELKDPKKGSHLSGSFSVSITMQYRAIYIPDGAGVNVWYWIGTHADYDKFVGLK